MIDNKIIYQVDAFTREPFKGNPAAVMIVGENESSEWMQKIANEMNLSETAFVIPKKDGFSIRYFTPTKEVPLCGHATLASAHIIYQLGIVSKSEAITFESNAGKLTVRNSNDNIVMDFPKYNLGEIKVNKAFQDCVGFEPIAMYESDYDWVIAIAQDEKEIREAKPKFESLSQHNLGLLMITSASNMTSTDFVVRCFAPSAGINEDPVTGSAYCALTPLWSERLNKSELKSIQVSERTGQLNVRLIDNRVAIEGSAVTVFTAKIH